MKTTKPMTVFVDQSPVGVGKTHTALEAMVRIPARYLFATERRESVREIEERLTAMSSAHPQTSPTIKTILSSPHNRGYSVATEIAALPANYANPSAHVCVIITHAALMSSDLSGFSGWHVVVDEVPAIIVQETLETATDRDFFERNYRLTDINGKWSRVDLTEVGKSLTSNDLAHCQSHDYLRTFHQRVASGLRAVVCDLQDWSDMEVRGTQWNWWSIFNVRQMEAFSTVKFLGSGFMEKLSAKMLQNYDRDVEWLPISTKGHRVPKHKTVNVHYFTDAYASRYYFESEHGQDHLRTISRHLGQTMPAMSYWSANDPARELTAYKAMRQFMPGQYISPKQAGTSAYQTDYHDAAMIYASKPSKAHKAVLEALGCTEQDWIETNEYETVLQFLTRTSVRDITTGGTTNLYVLSRDQADYLMAFFDAQPHISAHLHHIDLVLEYPVVKRGRPVVVLTPSEAAAKAATKREYKARLERERRARLRLELA
jgi:hypothetical protein